MIIAKIDVAKIDKARLFPGKNGAKYLDIILRETPGDKYGNDYMVVQSVTKEERQAGVKGAILGNAKTYGQPAGSSPKPAQKPANDGPRFESETNEDVPF